MTDAKEGPIALCNRLVEMAEKSRANIIIFAQFPTITGGCITINKARVTEGYTELEEIADQLHATAEWMKTHSLAEYYRQQEPDGE